MSDFPDREVEVFEQVLRLPVGERLAFLDRVCAGESEVRREVEALLKVHDHVGDFLEQSPVDGARRETHIGEKPGTLIGRYKLLEQIGEGGCGVVYLAQQEEPVRRQVALKIIKPGMDTKSVIARFEAERQVLALMDHPNIAKVFDAGATESGRPYFVMELVRGVKITEFCDRNSLTTEERLQLFVQVCRAIQHAHQKGIIHRDIKPSNVLVMKNLEGESLPVVIDFGIAKATTNQSLTDKTIFTAFEMLVGTPAYMSPEQVAVTGVDLDTRTDIYSLGVLLYELLAGSTPFDGGALMKSGVEEIRRTIREKEPERPSTRLGKLTRADLTTLAQLRRSEPLTLIRIIRGDLDWIAMKAMEKDRARRYETANGLALDVQRFLADEAISARPPSAFYRLGKTVSRNRFLFGGIGVIALVLIVSLVLVSVALAKQRHESAKSRQVTQFLEDMLRSVEPSVAHGRDTAMLKEILDQTTVRVGNELTNQPAVEAELRTLTGRVYHEIRDYPEAERSHRAALALNQKLHGEESPEAAASYNDLGLALWQEGKLAAAENALLQALGIQQRLFGNAHPDAATSLDNLANVYARQKRLADAEATARQALEIRRKWFGSESLEAARSLRSLSIILGVEGKKIESEVAAREVLSIRRKLLGSGNASVASALADVAWAAGMNGKLDEAESLEVTALAIQRKVLGDPHPDVARSLSSLGQRMQERGKLTESDAMVSAALSIQRKLLGEDHPDTLSTLARQAAALEGEGKWAEAEIADREALASWRRRAGNEDSQTLDALKGLIRVLEDEKKFNEAEQLLNETLTPEFVKQPASRDLLSVRVDLMGRRGRWQEAAADSALVCEGLSDDHYPYHVGAVLLAKTGNRPAYEQLCQKMLATYTNTMNPYVDERVANDCLLLPHSGMDLEVVDKLADAAVSFGKDDNSGLPWFQTVKAESAYRRGHFAEAIEWAGKPPKNAPAYARAHAAAVLARAHWQLGHQDEARAALASGDSLAPNLLPAFDSVDIGESWVAWLEARISLDEAAALIRPVSTAAADGSNKP